MRELNRLAKKKSEENAPKLTKLAFDNLTTILSSKAEDADSVSNLSSILKHLLPSILMSEGTSGATVPKHLLLVRQYALHFVKTLVAQEDQSFWDPIHAFLQHICTDVPEKAEFRTYGCRAVEEVYNCLPSSEHPRFVKFLERSSRNAKSAIRLFSIELSCLLLCSMEESQSVEAGPKPFMHILVCRASDKVATVRAKALASIAVIFQEALNNAPLAQRIKSTFTMQGASDKDKTDILSLLRRRMTDDKCNVRRSALQVLEIVEIIGHEAKSSTMFLSKKDLSIFKEACYDSAVSIRKQAIASLMELMNHFSSSSVLCAVFLDALLPMIMDVESSVQDKCVDAIQEFLLNRIAKNEDSAWLLLQNLDSNNLLYLQKICALLGKQKRFSKGLVHSLQNEMESPKHQYGCWLLLAEVASFSASAMDHKAVLKFWNSIKDSSADSMSVIQQKVLKVLECLAPRVSSSAAERLAQDLLNRLKTFKAPPALVQSFVQTLAQLEKCQESSEVGSWSAELLSLCDEALAAIVLPMASTVDLDATTGRPMDMDAIAADPDRIIRYLFTMGEISQTCPKSVPKRLVTVVQALISPVLSQDLKSAQQSVIGMPGVRAHAFLALGKLCLEDEPLAKKCIPAFARELETSDYPVVRNNIIIVMCDLCIKYTGVVDKYLPTLAVCLRDSNDVVRRQTLILLSRLLQESFVKWKGTMFYRFVVALVDPCKEIREFCKYCFTHLLATKNPLMFYTYFMETVFHLNDYKQHSVYNQFPQTEKDRSTFYLGGANNRDHRMSIYRIFLTNMTEEQKFQTTAKICQEVLGGIVDGHLPLSGINELLHDCFQILQSKEIKLKSSKKAVDDEDEEAAVAAAKEKILTKIVKKNVLENIVPIIIEMKHLLEKNHSPLIKDLMEYLIDMMKDYKDEIEDILVADKQLATELQYDLKQWALKKKQQLMSPMKNAKRNPLLSPVSASPRPEIANFSVPKIRTGLTPLPNPDNRRNSNLLSPFRQVNGSRLSLSTSPKSAQLDHVVVASPATLTPNGRRQWRVELQDSKALSFDDDPPVKEKPAKKSRTTKSKKVSVAKLR
eukprot:TRINITY_DN9493_c0_g1_i1.p1 TRINITY_DN9493_c0_g1~~TRINITY_DN9493_c0_g1_i1.p1  ORF type:complete len:1075 (-),score=286.46 TRINITY_DN9493_c0_g1_i1:69-3293(-)